MRSCMMLLVASGALFGSDSRREIVAGVAMSGASSPIPLSTRTGELFEPSTVERDVRAIHATGRFHDIRVESELAAEGRYLTFHLKPMPRLMLGKIEVVPDNFPLKLRGMKGDAIHPARARTIAEEYRKELVAAGYAEARVSSELISVAPSVADVRLRVEAGERFQVKKVVIEGDHQGHGRRALQALKTGWLRSPGYSKAAVEADMARVQSAYVAHGFVDAVVRVDHTNQSQGKAEIKLTVQPGRKYAMQADLCKCLHRDRKEAESRGIVDFSARASVDDSGAFSATTLPGRSYRIRRIEFEGNSRFADASLRRNLLLNEMEALDPSLLRKSLDRLNRSGMLEPLSERDVDVRTDERTGLADIVIHLRERKSGSWLLSGPVGPISLAGPARFSIASRLPSWGRDLLDLSSFYASLHLSPGELVFALQRPFVPVQGWASGFAIAPQLGWRSMGAHYAGNQVRERFLKGQSLPDPAIAVTVQRLDGETIMLCEPPGPRWPWAKRGLSMALQFGSMLAL